MAISENDILEVQYNFVRGAIVGKMIQYCRVTNIASQPQVYDESEFARSLFAKTSTAFRGVIDGLSQFVSVYVRNRTNPLYEAYSDQAPLGGTGGSAGAPFVAIGFRQTRATTATRHGFKRFPFPSETRIAGNNVTWGAGQLEMIQEVFGAAYLLEDPEAFYDDVAVQNVIIPRILNVATNTYEPDYDNPNLIEFVTDIRVTSQNSRKT